MNRLGIGYVTPAVGERDAVPQLQLCSLHVQIEAVNGTYGWMAVEPPHEFHRFLKGIFHSSGF